MLRGPGAEIRRLGEELIATKGVVHGEIRFATGKSLSPGWRRPLSRGRRIRTLTITGRTGTCIEVSRRAYLAAWTWLRSHTKLRLARRGHGNDLSGMSQAMCSGPGFPASSRPAPN